MTTSWPCDDKSSERFPIFTRANTGEVFSDAATPLTWSTFGRGVYDAAYRDGLYEIGVFTEEDFRPEGECEVVGCFGGYVYINVSISRVLAVRTPGMTAEAIDRSLFGEHPDVRPYAPHPADENQQCTERMVAWMEGLFAASDVPELVKHRARVDTIVAERPDLTDLSDQELVDRYRSLVPEMRPVFATHIVHLYASNIITGLLAQVGEAVGEGELVAKMTSGLGEVDSAQQSFDLWELSRSIRHSPRLSAAFEGGITGVLDRIRTHDAADAKEFLAQWDAFLASWGFLGPSVWEGRSPTYRSNPEIPLRMLDHARQVPDEGSPAVRTANAVSERDAAVAAIAAKLDDDMRGQFLAAAQAAKLYLPAREATKVQCTRLCEEARMTMRELGGRLVGRGILSRWEDVLLLMNDEFDAFLSDPESFRATIADRKTTLQTLEQKWPPFILDGPPPSIEDFADRNNSIVNPVDSGEILGGLGVAPGVHTGPARVVRSLMDDVDVEPGDVLIAMTTDSSWGPLFLSAGAVVCQTGAAISHAAIVARELGIPAAVSVQDCTTRIPDGTMITVDGSSGKVTVH
ncbi:MULTISPECIES: PEP-utilizing enzyme [unclassified Rhodococcus (in: high G+C Gram-positive bacteria)]|uniref:PEP-utilizing enzyme n=1 Tax=unclassified Rhodococcus (in: high G+C Gram-positive bacteria) TaxID=192944 RepID=UPI00163B055C|nr:MULTISPECIES: PEP-utilizing enzyme [unclassified Rhodococcus (in: high G+C Gram-positive bacteria)]MBC2637623.1 phosphoenolpyruvate-utilizing protein [Rhodococcus sp. 3A]MBC2897633.1 phosphoenolpyruvate-utilizing protein [Rhodococcus sp. 4CII]